MTKMLLFEMFTNTNHKYLVDVVVNSVLLTQSLKFCKNVAYIHMKNIRSTGGIQSMALRWGYLRFLVPQVAGSVSGPLPSGL